MSEQTSYAQSIAAAQALFNSVQKEQTEIEWLQSEYDKGTKAFRAVFDERKLYWPPENSADYWTMITGKLALVYNENKDNRLCQLFLLALLEYFEEIGKEREKRNGGELNGTTDAG